MPTIAEVRAKYPQYSDMSDVELAGALHDRFYSDMPPDQFAEKIGLKPDKYQQAAIDERAALDNPGDAGLTRRLAHGATLGADNTILAAMQTPLEMIRQGTLDPREGYNYAKAREDLIMNEARKNTGIAGTAAELLGGGVAGVGLARGGLTTGRLLSSASPGLLGRTATSAADAAALGGVAGFNEGNGLNERVTNAGSGALLGGLVGGAMPIAGAVTGAVASPFISNIMARLDPEGYARRQVARAFTESGRPVSDVVGDVTQAANEGQGVYTVADALGNSGQRMLSTVARAPGEGRTAVVNALEGRQGTQGRRISNALSEGFGTNETAAQTEARLTGARDATADAEYGAVRSDAKPVDITNVVATIDRTLSPGTAFHTNIANDSAEAALANVRNKLTDGTSNLTDFRAVQRVRGDLSDAAQSAAQSGHGNKARLLRGVLRELDAAMEKASAGHLEANRNFAQASRDIEAVQGGREAATRGRTEDTIPRYQALAPEGQAAFRSGYVDPLIANTQGAAFGVNKARPLLNDAFAAEAEAMAPGNALMQRRIGREQRMFETRNQALGNSKTAENLADADALGIDPSVVGHILSGNYGAAAKSLISAGSNAVTGNTPAVRAAVGNLLLRNGANVQTANFERMISETIQKIQMVQNMAREAGRGVSGALAVAPSATKKPNIFPKRKAR
ncbi:hypothetical protein CO678_41995 [Bradyrhizobium diazoefficiens]|uniref:hypothetical protein n=1 Tax=Bradyrhizobium diazoefficiens TaxID=1355477 RepID=UPI000BE9DF70|nr:hypothetical protein [Bradyrhizobium diazoefficiens]PDT55763.1 hypothetical protein CO678_41995 [Bradyrhizobium diazoefficiens]